jgi:BioD-like phosphotransacetylase family protein
MPVIVVSGSAHGVGATTVAAGLAHRLAYAGHTVRLERLAGDTTAERDAAAFSALEFAEASGAPIAADAVLSTNRVTVLDAGTSTEASTLAHRVGASHVVVTLTRAEEFDTSILLVNHARASGPLQLPEDRLLAAPTVGDLIEASKARVLARSTEGERALCEHIVIGAISHDSDQPYFARYPNKVVVTRAEKVDIALSALRAGTECLILTGGSDPSPYVLDRVAGGRTTTLLVTTDGTVETIRDIEGTFGRSAFAGEAKAERAGDLVAAAVDDDVLARMLGA